MLVLTRRRSESIVIIGPDNVPIAEVMVCNVHDGQVRLGIEAPRELKIRRKGRDGRLEGLADYRAEGREVSP